MRTFFRNQQNLHLNFSVKDQYKVVSTRIIKKKTNKNKREGREKELKDAALMFYEERP